MIIPTFIFKGRRYRITFLFFFFFCQLLPPFRVLFSYLPYYIWINWKVQVSGEIPPKKWHKQFLVHAICILTKERLFYKATRTISFAEAGSSSPSIEMLSTKFTWYFVLTWSSSARVAEISSPSRPASFKKLSRYITSRS